MSSFILGRYQKDIYKIMKENPEEAKILADQIINNAYRTLMTRGMKRCYVYCMDKELNRCFKKIQYEY